MGLIRVIKVVVKRSVAALHILERSVYLRNGWLLTCVSRVWMSNQRLSLTIFCYHKENMASSSTVSLTCVPLVFRILQKQMRANLYIFLSTFSFTKFNVIL